ncbi:MAG: DsbC family protein, partial [Gammaproteobacteria bacterium]|nr:DsbC family protein [Gammaproteobacteria bacterium]
MKLLLKLSLLALLLNVNPVMAEDTTDADIKAIQAALNKYISQAPNAVITPTPIKGLYQVLLGTQIAYMSKDGKYLLDGDMMDLESKLNLTETARG